MCTKKCTSGKFARKKVHGMCTNVDYVGTSGGCQKLSQGYQALLAQTLHPFAWLKILPVGSRVGSGIALFRLLASYSATHASDMVNVASFVAQNERQRGRVTWST